MSGGVGDTPPQQAPERSAPACYRHPGRETYIRCARCERYICPDCMTAAPVGFQCPECVSEGERTVRQPTTVLGGQLRERGDDLVTKILIGLNVGIWLIGMVAGFGGIAARFALLSGNLGGQPVGVADGEWYRLLTAAFVHEQPWHLALNMYALWILGRMLEPVLGRWRFVTLYLLSGLGGAAASLLAPGVISYGASGAVFGLMGALFVVLRRFGRDVTAVLVILAINVVFGFVVPGIDWRAHFGGLITGAVLAFAFAHAPRAHRALVSALACVAMLVVIIMMVAVRV
ncbi:MAG TPA: rhomboid family intramembrane serine protease [Mycobacterium sp.]|jgi:membrane associated rhomboid family serine protease|nr:rhomboid family intramembrane serine protease [Mycobacterium sp.]